MKFYIAHREDLFEFITSFIMFSFLESLEKSERFNISLAGGETPRLLYGELASVLKEKKLKDRFHFFFSDERCVPPQHPESNYRMALETLFQPAEISETNIHRIPAELDPRDAAIAYENELKKFLGEEPSFDISLLGLGKDGHTASIFPGSEVLNEYNRLCCEVWVEQLKSFRITLTPRVLLNAHKTYFVVTGRDKALALGVLRHKTYEPGFPAGIFYESKNQVIVFADLEAGSLVD